MPVCGSAMGWIIELRPPEEGGRYFTKRGKGVTHDPRKAKVFTDRAEAEAHMAPCTLWPSRRVIPAPTGV